jgi:hypothetical protein
MNSIDAVGETAPVVKTETSGFARRIICNGNDGGRVFLIEYDSTNMMLEEAVKVYFMVPIALSATHHHRALAVHPSKTLVMCDM